MKMRLLATLIAAGCVAACGGSSSGGGGGGGGGNVATFSVGVTVSSVSGSGMVLQLNGAGNLSVPASGFYTFSNRLASGTPYNVTVFQFPASPTQACAVSNGSGTVAVSNITNVSVTCTTGFTIGGTVTGMSGTGLVLQNNGGGNLSIPGDGPFTFPAPVVSGAPYNVTTFSHTPSQTCAVANATGTANGNINNVAVTCTLGFKIDASSGPLVPQQWHLNNTGQAAFADTGGVAGMDIKVAQVYDAPFGFSGEGVIAAVVDSGLEIAHEDLVANVIPGQSWNFNTSTSDPTNPATDGDHGTSVAGLIAAARNTLGGMGVAPTARLKGFNFLSSNQALTSLLDSLGASSSNPNSADVFVFNQSFGVSPTTPIKVNPTLEAQYLSGVTSLRGGKGALYVKAAGNGFNGVSCNPTLGLSCENSNFDPDNTLPYQIIVGATNADGIKASYSNAGPAIWVSAPGGEFGLNSSLVNSPDPDAFKPAMISTDQSGCAKGLSKTGANTSTFNNGSSQNALCNYTNTMNGTSSATPVTVGTIALILQANPALTWRDVKHILAATAQQVDATRPAVNVMLSDGTYEADPTWTNKAAGFNYHNWYGFGMVDASAAVNMARTYVSALGTLVNTGFISSATPLGIAIPDNSIVGASNNLAVPAGPVTVIEAVQIRVNLTHTFDGDLGIELISPAGTRSVLKNIGDGYLNAQNLVNQVFLSNAFYGENPVGTWTIKVVDGAAQDTGTLTDWAIRIYGH
jgi:subtilisin-like proprotein convertase family protein